MTGKWYKLIYCILSLSIIIPSVSMSQTKPMSLIQLSKESVPFLKKPQVEEDLTVYEHLIKNNYARYNILKTQGHNWEQTFNELKTKLLSNKKPLITQHFQKALTEALNFTEDPFIRTDLYLYKRHYVEKVGISIPYYTKVKLARQGTRYRVLPGTGVSPEIANHFFVGCESDRLRLFPILPERHGENRFILGVYTNQEPEEINCIFENTLQEQKKFTLPLFFLVKSMDVDDFAPFYEFKDGLIPYVRWVRDGQAGNKSTKQFFKVASQLRNSQVLILDIRGNSRGSFAFIEEWLKKMTDHQWKNVVVKEKLSPKTLKGLLTRLEWRANQPEAANYETRSTINIEQVQLNALLKRMHLQRKTVKWVETKFNFIGHEKSPKWNKKLIIIANRECGGGCQFLVALAKQQDNAWLVGENTGPYPRGITFPLYKLPNSNILLSLNHTIHLTQNEEPVSPSGYEPDYWLFPPFSLKGAYRFLGSVLPPAHSAEQGDHDSNPW